MSASFKLTTSLEIIEVSPTPENISICGATFARFHKICRLCLSSDNLKPFFDMTYKQTSVQSIIYDCSSLKVNPEDRFPYNLCEVCITELIRFYKFKKRCIQVTSILQDAYDNRNFTKGKENTIQSINSECFGRNEVNLIIKKKVTEDAQSIRSDCVLDDVDREGCSDDNTIDEGSKNVILSNNVKCNNIANTENHTQVLRSETAMKFPHNCSICNMSFKKKQNLTRHMLHHTGERPHKCTVCKKSFRQKYHLKDHLLIHTGEKPHKCSVCERSFAQKSALTSHMYVHTGGRPHKCNVCMKSFYRKSNLNTHMLIHKGERPHKCSVCEKSYIGKYDLNRHMLLHIGEKPHKCSVCMKSFYTKAHLNSHMLIHNGERPHKCTLCVKSFTYKSDLNRHVLIHTGEKQNKSRTSKV